jgi:hypothetical protein
VSVTVEVRVGVLAVPKPEEDVEDDLDTVPNPEKEEEAPPNNPVDPNTDGFWSVMFVAEDDVLPKAGVAKEKLLPNRGLLVLLLLLVLVLLVVVGCLAASRANGFWVMPKESVGLDVVSFTESPVTAVAVAVAAVSVSVLSSDASTAEDEAPFSLDATATATASVDRARSNTPL